MVPEAKVTFYDTMTLSAPEGWLVQAAAHAFRNGWTVDKTVERLNRIQERTWGLFTLNELKYLVHGGRISHIRGLVASMLSIKPIIGPEKVEGKYTSYGQEITWKRVIKRIPEVVAKLLGEGPKRVQLLHGQNMEGAEMLREAMRDRFECQFDPVIAVIAPVLGAHTGPTIAGMAVGDPEVFEGLS